MKYEKTIYLTEMVILKSNNMIAAKYDFYLKGNYKELKMNRSNDETISEILGRMQEQRLN